jgi:hypothetical protein
VEYNYPDEELYEQGLPEGLSTIARDVLSTIGSIVGLLSDEKPMLRDNFFAVGGNSINAVLTVAKLNDIGYKISMAEFIEAESILDLVKAVEAGRSDAAKREQQHHNEFFKIRPLKLEDKEQVKLQSIF